MEAMLPEILSCFANSELQKQSSALRQQVLEESLLRSQSAPGDSLPSICTSSQTAAFVDSSVYVGSGDWSFIPRRKSYPDPQLKPGSREGSLASEKETLDAGSPSARNNGLDTSKRLERKRQSNRESAKRMRKLRQAQLANLQDQVKQLEEARQRLLLKAVEDEQILKQIPLLVQQCKQLREDKRRLLELLSSRSILGMLAPAATRSMSLDSTMTAPNLRVMSALGGSDPGTLLADSCLGVQGADDAFHSPTANALLY